MKYINFIFIQCQIYMHPIQNNTYIIGRISKPTTASLAEYQTILADKARIQEMATSSYHRPCLPPSVGQVL
jgi:hypothetical protein